MYVISGASGHVGGAVARLLIEQGQKVRVIVRDKKKAAPLAQLGAEVAVGSLDDLAFLKEAFKGADGAFVLIPPNNETPQLYASQQNIANTIASAVNESGVKHVVLLSSVGADLPAGTGPIKGLHFTEEALKETDAVISAVRPCMFQENVFSSLAVAKQGTYYSVYRSPDFRIPMIATKDVAQVVVERLRHPPSENEVIDVTGPMYSSNDIANKLGRMLGKSVKVIAVPIAQRQQAFAQAGFSQEIAKAYDEMCEAFESGLVKAKAPVIREGKTTLDETLSVLHQESSRPAVH